MTLSADRQAELLELIDAVCEGAAGAAQAAQLEAALLHDPEAQWFYLQRIHLHASLLWHEQSRNEWEVAGKSRERFLQPSQVVETAQPVTAAAQQIPPMQSYGFMGTAVHGITGFFSQEVPFACFIAAVVMGIGLLIGANIYVSHPEPQQVARDAQDRPSSVSHEPMPELVGRITGMIDCRWSADGRPPYGYDNVPVGRQFKLDSGLMEITYHSGAKVILQGPCTYEVNSPAGGFLSLGKLTARVDCGQRKVDSAKPQASDIQHSSFSTHHSPSPLAPEPSPLFTIRTPTAIVTDLGTEFGVEVNQSGHTEAHVFAGKVAVALSAGGDNATPPSSILLAGQAIRVAGGEQTILETRPFVAKEGQFIRKMPVAHQSQTGDSYAQLVLSLQPVVYYRLEPPEDDEQRLAVHDETG